MRSGRNPFTRRIGCLIVLLGLFVLLALVLPTTFWWLMLAGLLIYVGIWVIRCR